MWFVNSLINHLQTCHCIRIYSTLRSASGDIWITAIAFVSVAIKGVPSSFRCFLWFLALFLFMGVCWAMGALKNQWPPLAPAEWDEWTDVYSFHLQDRFMKTTQMMSLPGPTASITAPVPMKIPAKQIPGLNCPRSIEQNCLHLLICIYYEKNNKFNQQLPKCHGKGKVGTFLWQILLFFILWQTWWGKKRGWRKVQNSPNLMQDV